MARSETTDPPAHDVGDAVPQPGQSNEPVRARRGAAASRRLTGGLSARRILRPVPLVTAAVVILIGWFSLAPLVTLVWTTVWDGEAFSFDSIVNAYSAFGISRLFVNSFTYAIGVTILSVGLGVGLAYLAARTNIPLKGLLFAGSLVPLITPPVLYTIAWIYLASPRVGLINTWLTPLFGPGSIDIFSMGGMIFVEGLQLSPLVFLLMYAAFKSMDPSLEESALMSGAKRITVVRRVTLPLAKPAIYASILIMMVRGLESFEVPALIGLPNGITVFTGRIWRALSVYPMDKGTAGAYSIGLLVLTALGTLWYSRLTGRGQRSFQTVTGKGYRPHGMDLGRYRWFLAGFVVLYFLVAVVLPFFVLAYGSTQSFYSTPTWHTLTHPTFTNFSQLFSDDTVVRSFRNSLILAIGSATAIMFVMTVASWVVVRTRMRGRSLLDLLSFLPLTVPGLVLGLALLAVYLRFPLPVYGTLWVLFIAYFTRFMPYGMRYASTSMLQIGGELEESARMSGASWWQVFRRVLFPLVLPGMVAGWVYIVTVSIRELSSSLLLYSPGNEVLSISIWNLWENGRFPAVAALGVIMILVLVVIIVLARKVSDRYGVSEV